MKKKYPAWALKHKKEGMAVHKIGENFYLYEITSIWDKELKRAKKVTKEYLGKLTPQGLIPPRYRTCCPTTCKEYGASMFLMKDNKEVSERLKECFPFRWKEIFVLSVLRSIYQSPLKHMEFQYQDSWLSEELPGVHLSKNTLSGVLESIGRDREKIVKSKEFY
jgi:hypothetical protein